jgi:hypothetical protein
VAPAGVPAPLVLLSLVAIPGGDLALSTKETEGYALRAAFARRLPRWDRRRLRPVAAADDAGLYALADGALERRDAVDLRSRGLHRCPKEGRGVAHPAGSTF